ncbi:hypothetical protein ACHAW6_006400 [Cyclotella cf. meneghiniana]
MVDIIPYIEDDDDSSTWVPLSAPTASSSTTGLDVAASATRNSRIAVDAEDGVGSVSSSVRDNETRSLKRTILPRTPTDEEDRGSSEWQELSSHSLSAANTSQDVQASSAGASQLSWEHQLIAHLASAAATTAVSRSAAGKEDGYSSENDEKIVWKLANELSDDDKLLFKRREVETTNPLFDSKDRTHNNMRALTLQRSRDPSCSIDNNTRPENRHGGSLQGASQETQETQDHDGNHNNRSYYRQAAKNKLQQSLIYDPIRALPLCFLRNLYNEAKHELLMVWNAYSEATGTHAVISPLTFFIVVALTAIAMITFGAFGFGSIVLTVLIRLGVTLSNFTLRVFWGLSTHLAWVSFWGSCVLGMLICILMIKFRKVDKAKDPHSNESNSQGIPKISTILPWMVALTSPSVIELVAVLYSLQALSVPIESRHNFRTTDECSSYSLHPTNSSWLTASIVSLLVIGVTSCGIAALAEYIERDAISCADDVTASSRTRGTIIQQHHHESCAHIKCHLKACHTLSVVILAALAVIFSSLRALYLYYGGSFKTIISGLGTVGSSLLYIACGLLLLIWAVNAAIDSVHVNTNDYRNFGGRGLCEKMTRNALKHSIIDISANVVWSNSCRESGISGVLSEADGTLRLAILEWLIDKWTSSSETSQSTNIQSASPTDQGSSIPSANMAHDWVETSQFNSDSFDGTDNFQSLPSYDTLQKVISKLDADEALIPAIQSYRTFVYSLPPSRNVAMVVAIWNMCPGMLALLLLVMRSALLRVKECPWTLIHSQVLREQCEHSTWSSDNHLICTIAGILAPLITLEYFRVRRWWARVACSISEGQNSEQTETTPDSLAIMVGYDFDKTSHSLPREKTKLSPVNHVILRMWHLLLDSITFLESSIPVVRCATVACAAANLTSDAVCLVDLAVEIKNRGLLCGIGMLIIDAFNHHLYQEIRRRQAENNQNGAQDKFDPDIGGKYTGAAINAVGNASKLAHNVSCLINNNTRAPDITPEMQQGVPERLSSSRKVDPAVEMRNPDNPTDNESGSVHMCSEVDSSAHYSGDEMSDRNYGEESVDEGINTDKESERAENQVAAEVRTTENPVKMSVTNEDDRGMPFWIGGGLAVVGAVIGGLAVAANMKKNDNKERRRSSQNS